MRCGNLNGTEKRSTLILSLHRERMIITADDKQRMLYKVKEHSIGYYNLIIVQSLSMFSSLSVGLRRAVLPLVENNAFGGVIYSAVFSSEANKSYSAALLNRIRQFAENEGRQPRILISRMGSMDQKDDHHRMIAATGFADLGFDVDVGPIVQTPEQVARQAVDADVHAIGARNLCSKHLTLIPELFKELAKLERPDILVLVADNIPPKDYDELYRQGVTAIFSPRSDIGECAIKILDAIEDAKKKNTVR